MKTVTHQRHCEISVDWSFQTRFQTTPPKKKKTKQNSTNNKKLPPPEKTDQIQSSGSKQHGFSGEQNWKLISKWSNVFKTVRENYFQARILHQLDHQS